VVLPVAPVAEKPGTFVDWEGRTRTFEAALTTAAMSDARILDALAQEFDVDLGCADAAKIRREIGGTPATETPRPPAPTVGAVPGPLVGPNEAILATWHQLIDLGSLIDGDEELAGTARPSVVRIGKAMANQLGVADGDPVTVSTRRGAVTLPAAVVDMVDGVVWLPTNSPSSTVRRTLGVTSGGVVSVAAGVAGRDGRNSSGAVSGGTL
jgi:NADH-quinone oxidoreductase subunit G